MLASLLLETDYETARLGKERVRTTLPQLNAAEKGANHGEGSKQRQRLEIDAKTHADVQAELIGIGSARTAARRGLLDLSGEA